MSTLGWLNLGYNPSCVWFIKHRLHARILLIIHVTECLQAIGGVLIGVGGWLAYQEDNFSAAINGDGDFQIVLAGPYIIIAAGCAIVLLSVLGVIGALCDKKINRFLLIFVSSVGDVCC